VLPDPFPGLRCSPCFSPAAGAASPARTGFSLQGFPCPSRLPPPAPFSGQRRVLSLRFVSAAGRAPRSSACAGPVPESSGSRHTFCSVVDRLQPRQGLPSRSRFSFCRSQLTSFFFAIWFLPPISFQSPAQICRLGSAVSARHFSPSRVAVH
jgi:hypothetical protein